MDLDLLQKVNELLEEGRKPDDIKHELLAGGIAPETVDEAIKETTATSTASGQQPAVGTPAAPAPLTTHREKVIQPEPGFDPNAK